MKHFYISLTIFAAIIICGVFSNAYVKDFSVEFYNYLEKFAYAETLTPQDNIEINIIKNEFFSKKNMLQFFLNKEHIQDIELDILLIEDAVKNNDAGLCRENSIHAVSNLIFLKESIFAVD